MILLGGLNFELPLTNPVIVFSLVLFIILFAPIIFNKIKVPHIIGLILAGVIIGPYGLNLLKRDSSIVLFGTVGLLYIMFLAGLEIDLTEFKKNTKKIIFFGFSTFILPLIFGALASYYILGFGWMSSILLASMFSTHTLISYPIASRYGVARNRAVTLTIGGTMITDILALLILAAIAGMSRGEVTSSFWVSLGLYSIGFVAVVFFVFPIIIRWFFRRFDDSVSQYIFVLAIVFLSAFLAEAAGIEGIIGAFFSGLVLNKFIPHTSPLMNRIEFVGNALFIPFFLISVGMLVDVLVLIKGWGALKVAGVIVIVAIATKYLAAILTQKVFGMSKAEKSMIFGLSTSHAAATLAIILVGYNIVIGETPEGEPIRLLNEDVLNGTILLILFSCAISSFVVERASRKLVLLENEELPDEASAPEQRILISLAYKENMDELIDFGLLLKPRKSLVPVYALHVVSDEEEDEVQGMASRRILDNAVKRAAATENTIIPIRRYDANISNGIVYTIKEHNVTDLVFGLHHKSSEKDFLGNTVERIVRRTYETSFIYRPVQPLNTLDRMTVVVTAQAELEPGFAYWFRKLLILAKEAGLMMEIYATRSTISELKILHAGLKGAIPVHYHLFTRWEDFLVFSGIVKKNDLFTIISSRKGHISYTPELDKLPYHLTSYFSDQSVLIVYPKQLEHGVKMEDIQHSDSSLAETINESVQVTGGLFRKIFGKKK